MSISVAKPKIIKEMINSLIFCKLWNVGFSVGVACHGLMHGNLASTKASGRLRLCCTVCFFVFLGKEENLPLGKSLKCLLLPDFCHSLIFHPLQVTLCYCIMRLLSRMILKREYESKLRTDMSTRISRSLCIAGHWKQWCWWIKPYSFLLSRSRT